MAGDASKVRVAVRVRPLIGREAGEDKAVQADPKRKSVSCGADQSFAYDHVFSCGQQQLYQEGVEPLLISAFEGYNVTILAYGQTGSGKTYTMGTEMSKVDDEDKGVTPRFLSGIFERAAKLRETHHVKVTCSLLEVYAEQLKDLLDDDKKPITLQSAADGHYEAKGLTQHPIEDAKSAMVWTPPRHHPITTLSFPAHLLPLAMAGLSAERAGEPRRGLDQHERPLFPVPRGVYRHAEGRPQGERGRA